MKKRLTKLLSIVLTGVMLLSNGTVFAAAGTTVDDGKAVADPATLASWESVFGNETLSTKDIGRIWTDKTVSTESISLSGDIGQKITIDKAEDADFQVALSALGSAAKITDTTKVPTDTVFVLDLSNNMWEDDNINSMISAANDAIKTLMNTNPQNRVAVVGYSTTSKVLLPLGHYLSGSNFLTRNDDTINMTATVDDEVGTQHTESFERRTTSSHKYTQRGIYEGMNILLKADTTAVVGETAVTRSPVMICMAEGEAKVGSERFINPPEEYTINEEGERASSRYAQSFVAAMTAAYMKEQVTDHYYGKDGESARIYTMGVDIAGSDAPALAYAYLDPAQTVEGNFSQTGGDKKSPTAIWALNYFKEKFNDYNKYGTAAIHTGSNVGGNIGWNETNVTKEQNNDAAVNVFEYNDQYYDVTDANWDEIFSQIADDVNHQTPSMPINTGAEGSGGESGKLVFTDELGDYMRIIGLPTIVFANEKYRAKDEPVTDGNTTIYTFEGEVTGNEIYGDGNLSDIKLTVTQRGDRQTLTWEIPANLLPLRTMKVDSATSESGDTTYTIEEENPAYPIRLFYSVQKDDNMTFDEEDNEYLLANTVDGKISYYAATWDEKNDRGNTSAVFTPAENNSFYHYTEDTPLYVLKASDGRILTTQQAVAGGYDTINPGIENIQVNGTTYSLSRAYEYREDCAYYYAHTYYQADGAGNTAKKLTDYHRVQNTANLQDNTGSDDSGRLYVRKGINKLSRVSDMKVDKENNATETASTCRDPQYTLTDGRVTIYLGNDGRLREEAPTGKLSVMLEPSEGEGANHEQKFEYTIGLYGPNGLQENGEPNYEDLNGTYSYTITRADESTETGTIENGGKVRLGENDTLEISGLLAGTAWQLTQTSDETTTGYTPVYSGDGAENAKHTGQLVYVGREDDAELDKSVTVKNIYDAAQVDYAYDYDANKVEGTASNPPVGGRAKGKSEVTLSKDMTHNPVDGKKVVFLGWYDGAQSDVNQIYGKDNKADFVKVQNARIEDEDNRARFYANSKDGEIRFIMPTRNVTLHAVWGYDENNDGDADVTEETYDLKYDANGGYFDDNEATSTKTVEGLLAQKDYKLDYSRGNLPKRADGDDGTHYAFIAWSTTKDDKIYAFGDTYTGGSNTVEISENTIVYAVWGVDTDGDGTADIREKIFNITATAGDGGNIEPSGKTPVMEGSGKTFKIKPTQGKAVDTITIKTLDSITEDVEKTDRYINNGEAKLPEGQSFTEWNFSNIRTHYTITVTFADSKDGETPDKYNRMLTYDANGGKDAPQSESGKADGKWYGLSSQTPTHDKAGYEGEMVDVIFLGWMTEANDGKIYEKGDKAPQTVERVRFNGEDITVYAAWGYDADGNGEADVTETYCEITTKLQGGGSDSSISPENPSVKEGEDQRFTITAGSGYAVKTIAVDEEVQYTNDDAENKFSGTWTLENVEADCTVTVTFAEDKNGNGIPDEYDDPETELSGSIRVAEIEWKTFLNKITLGHFFKETQTVTISGEGAKDLEIYYFLSADDLSEEQVKETEEWQAYAEPFDVDPNRQLIVYAKITDCESGRSIYLRSDRITVDDEAPTFSLENGKTYTEAQTLTVSDNFKLKSVKLNDVEQDTAYDKQKAIVLSANGVYHVTAVDCAGNEATITVTIAIPEPEEEPNLIEIVNPDAITGVPNGTAVDVIDFPEKVTIRTTKGDMQAEVTWDVDGVENYDPSSAETQSFTVEGTVTLPEGVTNTDNIPLTALVEVTVDAKAEVTLTGISVKERPAKTAYTEGEALNLNGLVVTLTYSDGSSKDVEFADFADEGIAVSPADGTTLSAGDTQVTVSKGGFSDSFAISVRAIEQVAMPTFSPIGGTYSEAQRVTISTSTEGAKIYYTVDGSMPTAESAEYTDAIVVDRSLTIKAIAVKEGMKNSEVASASYIIETAEPSEKYSLTVENGKGSGEYVAGDTVEIKADPAPEGQVFDKWVSEDGIVFADADSAETTFVMPGRDVKVTATYKDEGGAAVPDPEEPEEPDDPSQPAEPEQPEKPEPPKDPEPSEDPNDDPAASGDANRPEQGESTQDNPRTGDADNLVLWFAMLGISCMGLASAAVYGKRKNSGSKE